MSASTRTAQRTLGTRQLGPALLTTAAIASVLAIGLLFSQPATPKPQAAPAAGTPPSFIDHGSRDEMGTSAPRIYTAPVFVDHGSHDQNGTPSDVTSTPVGNDHGLHLRHSRATDGANGTRLLPQ